MKDAVLLKWWKGYVRLGVDDGDIVISGRDWEVAFSNREIYLDVPKITISEYPLGSQKRPSGKSVINRFDNRLRGDHPKEDGRIRISSLWKDVLSSFEIRYTPLDPVEWLVTVVPLYSKVWDYAIVSSQLLLFKTITRRKIFFHKHGKVHTIYLI
ncbi:MAG: hypothetical protein F7C32_00725 [Desulfurococcales archaeon]|nr:hypothetical protein [Desulfurococcales archaeon]